MRQQVEPRGTQRGTGTFRPYFAVAPAPFCPLDPASCQGVISTHTGPTSTVKAQAVDSAVAPRGVAVEAHASAPDPQADAARTRLDGVIGGRLKAFSKSGTRQKSGQEVR